MPAALAHLKVLLAIRVPGKLPAFALQPLKQTKLSCRLQLPLPLRNQQQERRVRCQPALHLLGKALSRQFLLSLSWHVCRACCFCPGIRLGCTVKGNGGVCDDAMVMVVMMLVALLELSIID
jgi:hypothetical protein